LEIRVNTKAVKWAWKQPIENQTTRIVLLTLALLANNMGGINASLNRIARESRLSPRTLIRHLNSLVYAGYIIKKQNYRTNGRRAVNTYYLAYGGTYRHLEADSESKKLEKEILGKPEEYDGLW
jgi:DNA-binding MarR family transcriptional regulator